MPNSLHFMCLALGLSATAASSATVSNTLFLDDFDLETREFNTELDHWTVLQGSVDVVGCGGSGGCVDLDGSMSGSAPTIIESKDVFDYTMGRQYRLQFDIPTGTQADPLTVEFGSSLSAGFVDYDIPLIGDISGTASSDGQGRIQFILGSVNNNNFGPYLTSVSLIETYEDDAVPAPVPLPASAALLGGALGLLALRRRRG